MNRQILQREKCVPLLLQTTDAHRAHGAFLPTCRRVLPWNAQWCHYPCVVPIERHSRCARQEVEQVLEPFAIKTRRANNE